MYFEGRERMLKQQLPDLHITEIFYEVPGLTILFVSTNTGLIHLERFSLTQKSEGVK